MGGTDVEPGALRVGAGREQRRGRSGVRVGYGNGSGSSSARVVEESVGSSWGSSPAATVGRMATGGFAAGIRRRDNSNARALDRSRGDSLQRSLAEAMKVRPFVSRSVARDFGLV